MGWTRTKDNVHRRNTHTHTHPTQRGGRETISAHTRLMDHSRPTANRKIAGRKPDSEWKTVIFSRVCQATLVDAGQDFRFSRQKRDHTVPLISCSNISTYTQTDRHDGRADGARHSGGLLVHPAQLPRELDTVEGAHFSLR